MKEFIIQEESYFISRVMIGEVIEFYSQIIHFIEIPFDDTWEIYFYIS